ncbi:14503_t:CDS:2, partial [Cetraspora pellucida]
MENIFEDWSKRDYNNFVNASAKYGRNALQEIASEIEGKTLDEVKAYAKVFWQRYQELPNHEEIIAKIVKGESKLQQTVGIQELLRAKVAQYRTPGHQLQVSNQAKGKTLFSEEEDRYLLIALAKYGYGTEDVYEKIRNEIENAEVFRFNWFIKSRTAGEIARRCTTLINLIQKEHGEEEAAQPVQEEKKLKKFLRNSLCVRRVRHISFIRKILTVALPSRAIELFSSTFSEYNIDNIYIDDFHLIDNNIYMDNSFIEVDNSHEDPYVNESDNLKTEEWEKIKQFVKILKPFQNTVTIMSIWEYSTLTIVVSLYYMLFETLNEVKRKNGVPYWLIQ